MRDIDRAGLDEDSVCSYAITNEQLLAEMDTLVLYYHHERLHGRQGHIAVGQGVRQAHIRQLVQTGLLPG